MKPWNALLFQRGAASTYAANHSTVAYVLASRVGELAALGTAICWTVTSLSFEWAGRRIGSLAVNIIRLVIALLFYMALALIATGSPFPVGLSARAWLLMAASGLIGFVIGDLCLFQAFVDIGARLAMLIFSAVPPITVLFGYLLLGEALEPQSWLGMSVTVFGIVLVVLTRSNPKPSRAAAAGPSTASPTRARGVLLALLGAVGQAGGLVVGRMGAGTSINPFLASEIRVIAGILGFSAIFSLSRRWRLVWSGVKNGRALKLVAIGSFFGPFLGVSLGLYGAQHTATAIASTIIATVPVLIIAPSVLILGERVTAREIVGAVIAVAGVAILFL